MRSTTPVDEDLIDMIDSVLSRHDDKAAPTTPAVDRELWTQLGDLGLVRLTGSEERGGSGAGWYEAAALHSAAARHAVRLPLPEHDLLAGWLAQELDLLDHDGAIRTVCVTDAGGVAHAVPWASAADRILVVHPRGGRWYVTDVPATSARIEPGTNLIGEPRDTVQLLADEGTPVGEELVDRLGLKAALVRAIQVCAALDGCLQLARDHVTSRIQFTRPLAAFQAVQGMVADIACESALARAATEAALMNAVESEWAAPDLAFRIAVARSCAGHATSVVVRNAHQIHGAIGTTQEHPLHHVTRAALAWRSESGSVRHWDDEVARLSPAAGRRDLWGMITGTADRG